MWSGHISSTAMHNYSSVSFFFFFSFGKKKLKNELVKITFVLANTTPKQQHSPNPTLTKMLRKIIIKREASGWWSETFVSSCNDLSAYVLRSSHWLQRPAPDDKWWERAVMSWRHLLQPPLSKVRWLTVLWKTDELLLRCPIQIVTERVTVYHISASYLFKRCEHTFLDQHAMCREKPSLFHPWPALPPHSAVSVADLTLSIGCLAVTHSGSSFSEDWYIICLPLNIIWDLRHLPWGINVSLFGRCPYFFKLIFIDCLLWSWQISFIFTMIPPWLQNLFCCFFYLLKSSQGGSIVPVFLPQC